MATASCIVCGKEYEKRVSNDNTCSASCWMEKRTTRDKKARAKARAAKGNAK